MIVDTSALIAILFDEPDANRYLNALMSTQNVRISAVTAVETAIVAIKHAGKSTEPDVASLFDIIGVEVVPFGRNRCGLLKRLFVLTAKVATQSSSISAIALRMP